MNQSAFKFVKSVFKQLICNYGVKERKFEKQNSYYMFVLIYHENNKYYIKCEEGDEVISFKLINIDNNIISIQPLTRTIGYLSPPPPSGFYDDVYSFDCNNFIKKNNNIILPHNKTNEISLFLLNIIFSNKYYDIFKCDNMKLIKSFSGYNEERGFDFYNDYNDDVVVTMHNIDDF